MKNIASPMFDIQTNLSLACKINFTHFILHFLRKTCVSSAGLFGSLQMDS